MKYKIFVDELVKDTEGGYIRFLEGCFLEKQPYEVRLSRTFYLTVLILTIQIFLIIATTPVICKCFPDFDYAKMVQLIELNENNRFNDKSLNGIFDSYDDTSLIHLIGVYDPTKQFLTVYGFSCS